MYSVRDNDQLFINAMSTPTVRSWEMPGPSDPRPPAPGFWDGVQEKAANEVDGLGSDIATWILEGLGEIGRDLGLWMIQVAPDTLVTLAMMFCLGAIASIPKTGKWAAAATVFSVLAEVIRKSTYGV
jgi:hypothetical protein